MSLLVTITKQHNYILTNMENITYESDRIIVNNQLILADMFQTNMYVHFVMLFLIAVMVLLNMHTLSKLTRPVEGYVECP